MTGLTFGRRSPSGLMAGMLMAACLFIYFRHLYIRLKEKHPNTRETLIYMEKTPAKRPQVPKNARRNTRNREIEAIFALLWRMVEWCGPPLGANDDRVSGLAGKPVRAGMLVAASAAQPPP